MVLDKVPTSFFCLWISSFPAEFVERLSFPVNRSQHTFQKSLTTYTKIYFLAFYSIPLVYLSVFMQVPYCFDYCSFVISFEIRKCGSSRFVLLLQDFNNGLLYFFKKIFGILTGIALNLLIALSITDILPMLIFPSHEHGVFFHFCLQFISIVSSSFQCIGLSPPLLNVFLGIIFFLLSL